MRGGRPWYPTMTGLWPSGTGSRNAKAQQWVAQVRSHGRPFHDPYHQRYRDDIDDEHDIDLPGLTAQADGSWLVDGSVTIRDLNRALGWQLPDEDASTLAGLVLFESRTIPMPGQEFRFHNIRFRVVKRDGNRITSLRLWSH